MSETSIQKTITRIYLQLLEQWGVERAERFRVTLIDHVGRPVLTREECDQAILQKSLKTMNSDQTNPITADREKNDWLRQSADI